MTRHDPTIWLEDMRNHAVEAVELLGDRTPQQVEADRVLQLALTRLVEIVGEAAGRVSDDVKQRHPELPWSSARRIRNVMAHAYDVINYQILCDTIRSDFPGLIEKLDAILEQDGG